MATFGNSGWDQSRFDSTLKELLSRCESEKWPRAVNKHGFFVSLAALKFTPRTMPEHIQVELAREITGVRKDGSTGPVPIGIAIAAKRASKGWVGQGNLSGMSPSQKKKALRTLSLANWRRLVGQKLKSMVGGRQASSGFIKAGWVGVLEKIGPAIGGKYSRSGTKTRGQSKGRVQLATPGNLNVTIENTAASRTENRGGFHRKADPAFQQALNQETNSMAKHIEDEMRSEVDKFNRRQH
jgi:hypothetical protein